MPLVHNTCFLAKGFTSKFKLHNPSKAPGPPKLSSVLISSRKPVLINLLSTVAIALFNTPSAQR